MSCRLTPLAGIARDCNSNRGGVKTLWLADYDDIASLTESNDVISAITMKTGKYFYQYDLRPNVARMVPTATTDASNGIAFVTTVISAAFARMDAAKRMEVNSLLKGNLVAVVEDNNGIKWYCGYDHPVETTASAGDTGQANTDPNNYTIELTDNSNDYPRTFTGTVPVNSAD